MILVGLHMKVCSNCIVVQSNFSFCLVVCFNCELNVDGIVDKLVRQCVYEDCNFHIGARVGLE